MDDQSLYYQHSGKFRADGIIWMLLFGVIAAIVLGVAYGYAIFYIPFVFLNFIITFFFGIAVGVSVGFGARLGQVRNMGLIGLCGLAAGILAEYTGWVAWLYAASEQERLMLSLAEMKPMLQMLGAYGVWSIFGWTPTGWSLYGIWLIEGAMIIGCASIAARTVLSSTPFCEQCKKWVETKESADALSPLDDINAFRKRIETAVTEAIASLGKSDDADNWTRVEWCYCKGCQQSQYLNVTSVKIERDDKNKESKKEDTLIENLRLSAEQLSQIRQQFTAG